MDENDLLAGGIAPVLVWKESRRRVFPTIRLWPLLIPETTLKPP